jgi:hypothetical protein
MTLKAVVAIGVGVAARSGAALAFGVDSLIELGSSGVLVWRLRAEFDEKKRSIDVDAIERKAGRIVGGALFALAAYVILQSAAALLLRIEPERSPIGIILAAAAVIGMPILSVLGQVIAGSLCPIRSLVVTRLFDYRRSRG